MRKGRPSHPMDRTANCCSQGGLLVHSGHVSQEIAVEKRTRLDLRLIWNDGQTMKFALRVSREAQED